MPRLTTADGQLRLDGRPWFMRAAEMQYFRIDRARWAPGLARLAGLGFNCISTYVPWIWHEPVRGLYDFTGASDPRRDVLGFARACRAAGQALVVRPGPFIYAEYQGFGQPRWLERLIPPALMRGPAGRSVAGDFWAAYSLGHPQYRAAVASWYRAAAGAFAGLWDDPIIAWQLDNETGFLYANGLGRWDWNVDTVRRFRAWLAEQYGDLAGVNAAWGTRYKRWEEIAPPRPPFREGLTQDYQRFLEAWVDDYLGWLRGTAQAAGVPVPFSHNDSANFIPPVNPAHKIAAGAADLPGYDLYVKMTGRAPVTDYPWGSACASAYFRAATPPDKPLLCWELGAGWFDPRARTSDTSLVNSLGGALAYGLKGFALYTAHDAVEATGHAYSYRTVLDAAGQPGPRYAIMRRLLAFLQEHERDLLAAAPPGPAPGALRVGFAFYYPDFRFAPNDFPPGLSLPDPARVLAENLSVFGIYAALLAAGYGPQVQMINLETARPADLAACTALVMPNKGALHLDVYLILRGYVENGGHLITCGRAPRRTLTGRRLATRQLYPAPVEHTRFLGRLPAFAYLGWEWLIKYHLLARPRLRRAHPTSLHILDLSEPLFTLFYAPQFGVPLRTASDATVRGDYMLQTYRLPRTGTVTPVLHAGRAVAGYRAAVGAGSSTLLGSLPGGSYFTPEYYRLGAARRAEVRAFWRALLTARGVAPSVVTEGDLELEVQHRPFPGGGFLFLINRLSDAQQGTVHLRPTAGIGGVPRQVFAGGASQAESRSADVIEVTMAAGDVVVLRWEG